MRLGVIGGTGLERLPLKSATMCSATTPWGKPSADLLCGELNDQEVVFLNRHGSDHSLPPHCINYRANIAALFQQQVDAIIAINAVGGIDCALKPSTLVLPDQIIDYTWGRAHTFSDAKTDPLQHVDFTYPYDQMLRKKLLSAAQALSLPAIDGAVHAVVQGPRLETAAEIRRIEQDGCQLVGMTGMPEAGLAREKAIPYACLALVVNPAAGKANGEITVDEIRAVMDSCVPDIILLLHQFCRACD